MRRKVGISVALVVVAVTVGILTSTSASGQTALHFVVGYDLATAFDDNNFDGLRLGDRLSARGPLMDESQTERQGTSFMHCVVHRRILDPDQGLWNCNYVLDLTDGDLMLQGLDPRGPGEYEMAVIGGTGAYAGARGTATFTDVADGDNGYTDMVIDIGG